MVEVLVEKVKAELPLPALRGEKVASRPLPLFTIPACAGKCSLQPSTLRLNTQLLSSDAFLSNA
jgi:hypothetical protein